MSYEVIARKWRPRTFDEVGGQSHVTTPLRNAIRADRMPHALLLSGPRGVGKTTLARILAHCLNCEQGPTDEPCGTCSACEDITSGRSNDVQEIDAASRNSVDDVRDLIDSIRYAPSPGKHRIYVIDEVHMLSKSAFNALLKTLEEPPPQSLLVFATTEPERIPFTVLSRCQRYDLRRIPVSTVVDRLRTIADAESVTISDASLRAIAREGDGSMRDAQTLMDQILSFGGSTVDDASVHSVLDLTDRSLLFSIAKACIAGDAEAALEGCGSARDSGTEPGRLGSDLVQLLRDLVVLTVAPQARQLIECTDEDRESFRGLAGDCDPVRLRRMFRALVAEMDELGRAPHPFAVLEMALVRLATMPSGDEMGALVSRLESLEKELAAGARPSGRPSGGSPAIENADPPATRKNETAKPPASQAAPSAPEPETVAESTPSSDAPRSPGSAAPSFDPTQPLDQVFAGLLDFGMQENRGLFASLDGGRLLECTEETLRIGVAKSFHQSRLETRMDEVRKICERFFGSQARVSIEVLDDTRATPGTGAPDRESIRQRRKKALDHEAINTAVHELDAQIVEIRPLRENR
ncbi:MAG: DNA polymerase III subunit gamma/tau [Myxococcota bacterium]|nr:DNA polymerase III subunit gamma/tau [Myxococcota bacterium]